MRSRLFTLLRQQPIALVALFIALGGSSYAAVSTQQSRAGKHDTILACVGKNTGALRVVESHVRCGSLETPISFNREGDRGPKGKRGPAGRAGAEGLPGAKGDSGAAGAKGDSGAPGAKGDSGAPGAKGDSGAPGAKGDTGLSGADGDKGDQGDSGDQGDIGAAGHDAVTATAAEPAGANCATGGVKLTGGIDANRNGVLDAGEVNASITRFVCNGAQGAQGPAGSAMTDAEFRTQLLGVDGSGSGVDADTVDGFHANAFLQASAFDNRFNGVFPTAFDDRLGQLFGTDNATTTNSSGGLDEFMGTVFLTANSFPPPGTAFAAGQTLSISQNSALFALLGVEYGGDGVTTFRLPDLRKQAPGGLHYVIVMNGVFPSRP